MSNTVEDLSQLLAEMPGRIGEPAYALLSGYPAACFARLLPGGLDLPPDFIHLRKGPFQLPWTLFFDVRIFGPFGECHAWREGNIWRERTQQENEVPHDHRLKHYYPILGTRVERIEGDWALRTEERGTAVWVPKEWAGDARQRPVLQIDQILKEDPDPEGPGLWGVADAMILGFELKEAGRDG